MRVIISVFTYRKYNFWRTRQSLHWILLVLHGGKDIIVSIQYHYQKNAILNSQLCFFPYHLFKNTTTTTTTATTTTTSTTIVLDIYLVLPYNAKLISILVSYLYTTTITILLSICWSAARLSSKQFLVSSCWSCSFR